MILSANEIELLSWVADRWDAHLVFIVEAIIEKHPNIEEFDMPVEKFKTTRGGGGVLFVEYKGIKCEMPVPKGEWRLKKNK